MWGQPPSAVRRAKPGKCLELSPVISDAKKAGTKSGPGIQVGWLPGENLKILKFQKPQGFNPKPSRTTLKH
jgi:hypothetical protein